MSPKFVTLVLPREKLSQLSFHKDFTRKNNFLKFNNLGLVLEGLEILRQCDKYVKTRIQKVLTANSCF